MAQSFTALGIHLHNSAAILYFHMRGNSDYVPEIDPQNFSVHLTQKGGVFEYHVLVEVLGQRPWLPGTLL